MAVTGRVGDDALGNQSLAGIIFKHTKQGSARNTGPEETDPGAAFVPYRFGARTLYDLDSAAATATTTVTTSARTTLDALAVWNTGDESIRVEWYEQKGRQAALTNLVIASAAPDTIQKLTVDWETAPEWVAAGDWVFMDANMEDTGNQSTYALVQSVSGDTITLAQDSTTTANVDDDTGLVYVLRKNCVVLPKGGMMMKVGGADATGANGRFFVLGNLSLTGIGSAGTAHVSYLYT